MKTLPKIKLNLLNKELSIMEKLNLKGGYDGGGDCCCGCAGPSSTWDNQNANSTGLTSPGGCHNCNCGCTGGDAEVNTNFMHE